MNMWRLLTILRREPTPWSEPDQLGL